MNLELAQIAQEAILDPVFEQNRGYCCRFVRQCVQKAFGFKYAGLFRASARETAFSFIDAGYGQYVHSGAFEVGDIIFKLAMPYGHVGIVVDGGRVAENSSTHIGRVQGAKGYRTLDQFGLAQVVGRLPDEAQHYSLCFDGHIIAQMPVMDGAAMAPVRQVAEALCVDLDYDEASQQVFVGGKLLAAGTKVINGYSYEPVRELAAALGRAIELDSDRRLVILI